MHELSDGSAVGLARGTVYEWALRLPRDALDSSSGKWGRISGP